MPAHPRADDQHFPIVRGRIRKFSTKEGFGHRLTRVATLGNTRSAALTYDLCHDTFL